MEEKRFNAFMPLDVEKSLVAVDEEARKGTYFCGFCSTPTIDRQGDIVNPKGITIDLFLSDGYINYEHDRDKVIGVPTEKSYVDPEKGLYLEAKIFDDNEYAKEMITLADNLKKSGTGRKLGFSIEGYVKKRNINDNRIIEELVITNVGVVKTPANQEARLDVVLKSFLTGHGITPESQEDAGALRRESLADSITQLTYTYKIKNPKEHKDLWNGILEQLSKSDNMGFEESVISLQLAKGLSRKDAELAVMDIRKSKLDSY